MKDDVGAKSAIPPGALRPFPAKGADAMKGAGTSLKPPPRFPAGTCFEWGDPGHWRKECPKVARGSVYPFSNSEHLVDGGVSVDVLHVSPSPKPWVKMGVMRCQNVCLAGAGRCKKVRCMEVL